ncbi:MAG: hypothetical protein NZ879_08395, partial [Archaeoglobaceae archaeon]|nr:hypothetical protein [Archaeoglobaceae archaeon]MDW8118985.1 hypothetical protein [Archaeoglobaceae archaeon]
GLEKMGFDCSSLRLAIVKVRRNLNEENYAKLPMKAINLLDLLQNLNENKSFGYEKIEEYYIHWWKYDGLSEIETELKEKLEYWKKKKPPVKVNNPKKCRNCPYKNECLKTPK